MSLTRPTIIVNLIGASSSIVCHRANPLTARVSFMDIALRQAEKRCSKALVPPLSITAPDHESVLWSLDDGLELAGLAT